MAQTLANSNQLALTQLLKNAMGPRFKLWAKNAPYEHKDNLRTRKYRWDTHPIDNFKAWSIELPEDKVAEEMNYLKTNVFHGQINIPIEVLDAYNRFSSNNRTSSDYNHNINKYHDKISWVNTLQRQLL